MDNSIEEEKTEIFSTFKKIRKKDFSGNSGQIVKNSIYQFSQNIIFKLGSLLFTIIIARILLPEKMGLYSLALSTIVFFSVFSDLGISDTLIVFCSRMLGKKKPEKAKGYFEVLRKWKINLVFFSSFLLLISSYFISNYYYNKPIFFALLIGSLYLPITSLIGFAENLFKSEENFKIPLVKEIIFQIVRCVIVPLTLLFFINSNLSTQGFVVIAISALAVSYFISLMFLFFSAKKKINFLKFKSEKLDDKEKKDLKKFIFPLSTVALAGTFFGYIDTLMLGRYVPTSYIAYYSAAFSLVSSGATIISFISTAVMPTFSRGTSESLKKLFNQTQKIVILFSLAGALLSYFISYFAIRYAYGIEYLPAVPLLKAFSILIFLLPILNLYTSYFISQGKTRQIASILIFSTLLNIILNFFGINYGLNHFGEMGALYGALTATIISRIIYLIFVVKMRKN